MILASRILHLASRGAKLLHMVLGVKPWSQTLRPLLEPTLPIPPAVHLGQPVLEPRLEMSLLRHPVRLAEEQSFVTLAAVAQLGWLQLLLLLLGCHSE